MTYRVGLTGGIGSGKSTVAALFAELGVPVIDTDIISHQLTQSGGAAIAAIRKALGDEYITDKGALDREKVRQRIFSDPESKQILEDILHPLILKLARNQVEASTAPYVLIVVPLLFETQNFSNWMQRTLTVDASEATQLARVTARQNISEQNVRAIMAQQLPRSARLQLTDDTIENEGGLSALQSQVSRLNQHYLKLAKNSVERSN